MKYLFGLLLLTTLFLTSCQEEVDLTGDFKETAVIHGILDQADTMHYIKINRAFIGPGNAVEIAQIPDSSYFTDVVATITEYNNGSQTQQWILKDTLVDNKDTNGVFYAPQQKLYYFKANLNASRTYKLNVSIDGGKYVVTGSTELVTGISSPTSAQQFRYKFSDDPASYINQGIVASTTGNSHVLSARLYLNFYEFNGVDSTMKTVVWNLGESEVEENSSKTFTAVGQTFYNLIKANATNDPNIIKRRLESITLKMTGGAEELYNYMSVNEPSSTLAQTKPTYTNLQITGDARVIGIFSSRQTITIDKPIVIGATVYRGMDQKSTSELCIGPITGSLFFCSSHGADSGETWYCN